jgi:hypothetical protein
LLEVVVEVDLLLLEQLMQVDRAVVDRVEQVVMLQ